MNLNKQTFVSAARAVLAATVLAFGYASAQLAPNVVVVSAPAACPSGFAEQAGNLVVDDDFASAPNTQIPAGGPIGTGGFTSGLDYDGRDLYPADQKITSQTGDKTYLPIGGGVTIVAQSAFPGDPGRNVAATQNWVYSNGNNTPNPYILLDKSITGLTVGRTYLFFTYVSNTITPGRTAPTDPDVTFFLAQGGGGFVQLGAPVNLPDDPAGTDRWILVQQSFVATSTTAVLRVVDSAIGTDGDDFGITRLSLRECKQAADLAVDKTGPATAAQGSTVNYTLTATNPGAINVTAGGTLVDNVPANITGVNWTCTANGTADCDTTAPGTGASGSGNNISLSNISINAGAGNNVTLSVSGTASTVGSITNTATIGTSVNSPQVDTNTANNSDSQSTVISAVSADVTITKTGTAAAAQGGAVSYTLRAWNNGPDAVSGVTITDNVPAAITGVTWTCTASGTATCGTASGAGNNISLNANLPVDTGGAGTADTNFVTIAISGTASTVANVTNTANIANPAGVTDPGPSPNSGSQNTNITANPGTISGTLYRDNNASGTYNPPGDTGLPANIAVELVDSGNTVVSTVQTNASGQYTFTNVPPATYTVRVVATDTDIPAVLRPTAPTPPTYTGVVVSAGGTVTRDFGFQTQAVDVIKSAGTVAQVNATTFTVPYTVVVGNTGQLPAPNVQVTELLTRTFSTGSPTITITAPVVATPSSGATCTANASFNGTTNTGLLSGANTLTTGQSCTITFTVQVVYANESAVPTTTPQNNTVYASSTPTGPNPGYTFPGGTPTPPAGATTDTSTNVSTPATPAKLPTSPNGDTPSATPVSLAPAQPLAPPPVARDDAKAGDYNQPVTVPAILNDSASPGTNLASGSIDLDPSTPGQDLSRTIPGKGTFEVQPDGTVKFTPVNGFAGTAVVPYTIKDNLGQTSNVANIAVTIRPPTAPPTANDDSATTPKNTPVTLDAKLNDSATLPNTLNLDSIDLDPALAGRQTTKAVPGKGTFEAQPDGTVKFTPEPTFVGVVTIPYTINDNQAQVSNQANLTVTVTELPAAVDDRATTPLNTPVNIPFATNDVADTGRAIVPSTIDLDPATPGQQTSVTVPGQGTFQLQPSGQVRFTPVTGFVGTAAAPYTVKDNGPNGGATTNPAAIIVTVVPPAPTAANDQTRTPYNTSVTLYPSTNDTPGTGAQLLPSTIDLDPATPGQQTTRTVVGQGTFVLQPATNLTNESVQFIPANNFSGTVTIPYTIKDNFGQTSNQANLTVIIDPPAPPVANDDYASTKLNTPVGLNPIPNDSASVGTTLNPATLDLDPSTPGVDNTVNIPGQGTFVKNPDNTVTFTPVTGFTGTVQAPYIIKDSTGQTSNQARLVVIVSPLPAAANDSAVSPFNTPVTLNPLTNDTPNNGATFTPATLDLDPSVPGVQSTVTVTGKGTFVRNPDGTVTFTPVAGFSGTVTVPYVVQDSTNATTNQATISVTIRPPAAPVANPDETTTPYNTPVTLTPAVNDTAGSGGQLVPGTIDLDPATPGQQTTLVVPGKGTFTLNPSGTVTFTPVDGFAGTVEIPYTIRDDAGQESNPAPIRVTVAGPKLTLTKTAVQGVVRTGGVLEYILRLTNESGVPMRQVTVTDVLPLGLTYRTGTTLVDGVAAADPQITLVDGRQRLVWVVGNLATGQSVSIRFGTSVTAAAPANGKIVNTADAIATIGNVVTPTRINSNTASATVTVLAGVFSDKATLAGRVYFDKNNNNNFDSGTDEPLPGVRVYLSDGRYAVTDANGRYSLSDVAPGLNTVRVDRLTVPYVPKAVPDDRGLRGTRYVRVDGTGIYNEDFLFEAPSSEAKVVRSTRVTVNGQRLEKTVTQAGSTYTATLTLTLNKAVNNLRIVDPLPAGASRGTVSAAGLQPNAQGGEIRLGSVRAGTYTITYTLTGLAIERLVTDPDLLWDEVRR
jgi:uncharacterized repeat protein (TIGR01451 family)/fimbrial isopeptide formation D2 family protein